MKYDEDLFADTTMTFGEHLDELRMTLFKALSGLVIGVLLGLAVGKPAVALIEAPLTEALEKYYLDHAKQSFEKFQEEVKQEGGSLGYTQKQIDTLVNKKRLVYELHYVEPAQLAASVGVPAPVKPAATSDEDETEADAEAVAPGLVPILFWHSITDDDRTRTKSLSTGEPFGIWMKASLVVGIILSSPWVFYHVWEFVAAGLYPHEKRYIHIFLPFSLGLFFLGVATAYLFVFQPVLSFLLSFNQWLNIDPDPRISEWLSFVLLLPLGFGESFQLPLVMLFLERIGIFDVSAYLSKWRLSVLVIFILSAVLTPADPYSLLLMAIPLVFLYFGGILLCRLMPRPHKEFEV